MDVSATINPAEKLQAGKRERIMGSSRAAFGRVTVVLAALAVSIAGFGGAAISQSEPPAIYKDSNQPIDRRVEDLLSRMTLEEKVAQMISVWEHKDRIQTPSGDF